MGISEIQWAVINGQWAIVISFTHNWPFTMPTLSVGISDGV